MKVILLFLFFNIFVFGQKEKARTTYFYSKKIPVVEFNFGLSQFNHTDYKDGFSRNGFLDFQVGLKTEEIIHEYYLLDFEELNFFASYFSFDFPLSEIKNNQTQINLWRFGFNGRSGYGYKLSDNFSVNFYHSIIANWINLESENYNLITNVNDKLIIDRYRNALRFGTGNEGGLKFNIGRRFTLNLSVEGINIYPRYMPWKNTGSLLLEYTGIGFLNYFLSEVYSESPDYLPILNFILKNAYSYAWYKARSNNMNWPFDSEIPLSIEAIKIGIAFNFKKF